MSKTTTRTSGMKRKHDEISSAATPTSSSAQPRQGWQQQQEGSTSRKSTVEYPIIIFKRILRYVRIRYADVAERVRHFWYNE